MIYKGIQYARAKKKCDGSCAGCYFLEYMSSLDCMLTQKCYEPETETNYIWIKVGDTKNER